MRIAPRDAMLLLVACAASAAHALPRTALMSQLGHTAWQLQDGVFPGSPTSIAQTADG